VQHLINQQFSFLGAAFNLFAYLILFGAALNQSQI
jgi:hypothetical protein